MDSGEVVSSTWYSVPSENTPRLNSCRCASAFEQENISPDLAEFADTLPRTNFVKSAGFVQRNAPDVLRKNSRLQSPNAVALGFCD